MATINGKSFTVILEELRKPFTVIKINGKGKKYVPIDEYFKRVDEVVGPFNYNFEATQPEVVRTGSQDNIILLGTLTIKDDNGNEVARRAMTGIWDINYPREYDVPTSVRNNGENACTDAFKRCWKMFGIGGCRLDEDELSDSASAITSSNTNASKPMKIKGEDYYEVVIKSKFSSIGTSGFKVQVANRSTGELMQLMIWKDAIDKIEKVCTIDKFIQVYSIGKTFKLYAEEEMYNNSKQLKMTNVYVNNK